MQGEKQYKTGLDVGSTTAKIVIIDESGQTVFSRYERHNAQVNDLLSAYFREARQELGDIETSIAVTGSVGMGTAEQLRTEFIQEVVAATRYAQQLYPSAAEGPGQGGDGLYPRDLRLLRPGEEPWLQPERGPDPQAGIRYDVRRPDHVGIQPGPPL